MQIQNSRSIQKQSLSNAKRLPQDVYNAGAYNGP